MSLLSPILQRLQSKRSKIGHMPVPGAPVQPGRSQRFLPALEELGVGKYTRMARNLRFLDENRLGSLQPKSINRIGRQLLAQYTGLSSFLHLKPAAGNRASFWPDLERVLPSAGPGDSFAQATDEPGTLRQGSIIQRLPTFPKPGQSLDSFKDQVQSRASSQESASIPRKRPQPGSSSFRRFTRVEELTGKGTELTSRLDQGPAPSHTLIPPHPGTSSAPSAIQRQADEEPEEYMWPQLPESEHFQLNTGDPARKPDTRNPRHGSPPNSDQDKPVSISPSVQEARTPPQVESISQTAGVQPQAERVDDAPVQVEGKSDPSPALPLARLFKAGGPGTHRPPDVLNPQRSQAISTATQPPETGSNDLPIHPSSRFSTPHNPPLHALATPKPGGPISQARPVRLDRGIKTHPTLSPEQISTSASVSKPSGIPTSSRQARPAASNRPLVSRRLESARQPGFSDRSESHRGISSTAVIQRQPDLPTPTADNHQTKLIHSSSEHLALSSFASQPGETSSSSRQAHPAASNSPLVSRPLAAARQPGFSDRSESHSDISSTIIDGRQTGRSVQNRSRSQADAVASSMERISSLVSSAQTGETAAEKLEYPEILPAMPALEAIKLPSLKYREAAPRQVRFIFPKSRKIEERALKLIQPLMSVRRLPAAAKSLTSPDMPVVSSPNVAVRYTGSSTSIPIPSFVPGSHSWPKIDGSASNISNTVRSATIPPVSIHEPRTAASRDVKSRSSITNFSPVFRSATGNTVQRLPDDDFPPAVSSVIKPADKDAGAGREIDLDQLAKDVLPIIKRLIDIESERFVDYSRGL